jgi:xylan 1,4-beta-xylosidase
MKKLKKLLGIICILSMMTCFNQPIGANDGALRQPPGELKDLCYYTLWDVLLHPTTTSNNRPRQDTLHQIAELLSKVGYPVESKITSRREFSVAMNQKNDHLLYELIDYSLIELCMMIRGDIPIHTVVTIDYSKPIGSIRDFRQVNDGIFFPERDKNGNTGKIRDYSSKMKELGMQSIRTHDAFGLLDSSTKKPICALDMHYLYPDTSKDPLDPKSYQFQVMDQWVQKIRDIGATVFFRIGESWGMDPSPPKNMDNYVQATVQILKHYNHGWANGFSDSIPYWEIWNEPGLKIFWTGSSDQFIQMYGKIALALKAEDPHILVGGPGNAGNFQNDWYFKLFSYIRDNHIPFDFYSWHWYGIRPYEVALIARDVQKDLESFGFFHTKQMITEWNIDVWGSIEGKKVGNSKERGNQFFNSSFNAAFHGCALTFLQDSPVVSAYHYRGDANGFGLLDEQEKLNRVGMFYQNLNSLMTCKQRLIVKSEPNQEAFTCLAGREGDNIQLIVSDARIGENPYEINLINIPYGSKFRIITYRLQPDGSMKVIDSKEVTSEDKLSLSSLIPSPCFDRIEISLIP